MRLLIANGQIVTPAGLIAADIVCVDGKIDALTQGRQTSDFDDVLDVSGKLVFPGFIDPHVHSREPGQTEKEDFAHSTLGALTGGVTTILEMPNAIPPVHSAGVFEERRALYEKSAWTDFGMWGMAIGGENLSEIAGLFAAGAVGVKLFWGYALRRDTKQLVYNLRGESEAELIMPPDNGTVLELAKEVARANGVLAAHCEDRDVLAASERALGRPVESYDDFLFVRPDLAESTSIAVAAEFAGATGCRFHVLHVTSARALAVIRSARDQGISITGETCPHYLTLTDQDYDRVGPVMKVYPPVRGLGDQDALWAGVADGSIVSVGSDHAPHTVQEKTQAFPDQPAGAVGCETLGPVMVDAMVRGKISAHRLAEVMSTGTAKLYGLYPAKGAILPGSDADFTIVDLAAERVVRNSELRAKQPVSPWDGVALRGIPVAAVLRGEIAMRDGEPVGERRGRFVAARHGAGE